MELSASHFNMGSHFENRVWEGDSGVDRHGSGSVVKFHIDKIVWDFQRDQHQLMLELTFRVDDRSDFTRTCVDEGI